MEVEMLEDDVFFAELSKRISLLITDDDDADFAAAAVAPLPGFGNHVPQQRGASSMLAPPAYTLFHHAAASYGDSTAWQQQCCSKGTGVFIPRSTPDGAAPHKKQRTKRANKARAAGDNNALAAGAGPRRGAAPDPEPKK